MFRILLITMVGAVSLAVGPAAGQVATAWEGQVTGSDVYVRSGADENWYPILKLSHPARVKVVGKEGDWYEILPPPQAYSLVSKLYVKPEATLGAVGIVTKDNVLVRAGSHLRPMETSRTHGVRLNRGQAVTIVGATEEYYKIVPPKGVTVFISARYVKPVGAAPPIVPPTTVTPATTTPTTTTPVGVTPIAVSPPTTRPTTVTAVGVAALRAVEAELRAEIALPPAQRDLPRVLASYKAIKTPPAGPLTDRVQWGIRYVELTMARARSATEANQLMEDAAAERQRLDMELARIRMRQPIAALPPVYTVMGRLRPSALYSGRWVARKRWTVRDNDNDSVICLAECATEQVPLAAFEGWNVVLKGHRRYDPAVRTFILEVITAEKIPGGDPIVPPPRPRPRPVTRPAPPVPPVVPSPPVTSVVPTPPMTVENPATSVTVVGPTPPVTLVQPTPLVTPAPPEITMVKPTPPVVPPKPPVTIVPSTRPAATVPPTPPVTPPVIPPVTPTPPVPPPPLPTSRRAGPPPAPPIVPLPKTGLPMVPTTRPVSPVVDPNEYN